MEVFSRILVPTDFSEPSQGAWRLAQRLAYTCAADLVLLHVLDAEDLLRSLEPEERRAEVRTAYADDQLGIARATRDTEVRASPQEWAEGLLEGWADEARRLGLPVKTLLRSGVAYREIAGAAHELGADLVVLSTHGRGGFDRFVNGSVADHVIRAAPCPVLAVRRPSWGTRGE